MQPTSFEYANKICVNQHRIHPAMGFGVYAVDGPANVIQIPKGGEITGYEGRIQLLGKRVREDEKAYVFEIHGGYELVAREWGASVDVSKVDTSWVGARINNGCGEAANCVAVCYGEGADQYVVFIAERDIYSGEELLWFYNERYLMEHFTRAAPDKDPAHARVPGTNRVVTCLCPTHELDRSKKELAERRAKRAYHVKNRCGRRTKRHTGVVTKLDEVSSRVDELEKYFERIRERCCKTKKQKVFAADLCSEPEKLPEAQQPSVPEDKAKADVSTQTEQLYAPAVALQDPPQRFSESYVKALEAAYVNLLSAYAVPEHNQIQLLRALSQPGQDLSGEPHSSERQVSFGSPAPVGDDLGQADQYVQDNGGACNGPTKYKGRAGLVMDTLLSLRDSGIVQLDIVSRTESSIGIPFGDTLVIERIVSHRWDLVIAEINSALGRTKSRKLCETAAQYFRDIAVVPRRNGQKFHRWALPVDGVWEASVEAAEKRRLRLEKQHRVDHATN